jgi:hypothetical protein
MTKLKLPCDQQFYWIKEGVEILAILGRMSTGLEVFLVAYTRYNLNFEIFAESRPNK